MKRIMITEQVPNGRVPQDDADIDISQMHSFRGVWTLARINPNTERLQVQFYTWTIVYGKDPIWVIYDKNGRFIRYANGRDQITGWYPGLTWRRAMCRWSIVDTKDHSVAKRSDEMKDLVGKTPPKRKKALTTKH